MIFNRVYNDFDIKYMFYTFTSLIFYIYEFG